MLLLFALEFLVDCVLITFFLPRIKGFRFSGEIFPQGLIYGGAACVLTNLVWSIVSLVQLLAPSAGWFMLLQVLLFAIGFSLNAIKLKLVEFLFPECLAIDGWRPAIDAGMCLMMADGLAAAVRMFF